MNTELAKAVAEVIHDMWHPSTHRLQSGEVYKELVDKGVTIPDGDMNTILEEFKKAGIITGRGFVNSSAIRQHGAMVITSVNLDLLDQLDFD